MNELNQLLLNFGSNKNFDKMIILFQVAIVLPITN